MKLPIFTYQGKNTDREISLDKSIFGINPNQHTVYLDIKRFRAAQRQGTHKTKDRSEITGSTRKIQKQKGTGNARKGDANANILRGGSRVHGPRPADHSFKLNKKQKTLARKSALSYKAEKKQIRILEDFSFENPKTKTYVDMLAKLQLQGKKTLLIVSKKEKNIFLAGKNIPKASITVADQLNTYFILNADYLLISESSLFLLEQNLK